jgi:hypothetical protein
MQRARIECFALIIVATKTLMSGKPSLCCTDMVAMLCRIAVPQRKLDSA